MEKGNKCSGYPKWTPTSTTKFEEAETKMYEILKTPFETKFIEISNKNVIRTIKVGEHDDTVRPPIILVHGFAAGSAFWIHNLDVLAKNRNVYSIDMLGFARSSRPVFPTDSFEADKLFTASIEDWRRQIRINEFILLGHSFGGYVSSLYTLKYPERVLYLILDDPWGFPHIPEPGTGIFADVPKWKVRLLRMLTSFNPLSALRAAGPLGPSLVGKFRSDIVAKYASLYSEEKENPVIQYLYHCNAQKPSGETAFQTVSDQMVFAKNCLLDRFKDFPDDKPFAIITGSDSWVNSISDFQAIHEEQFANKTMTLYLVDDAGHHVHADQPVMFNDLVLSLCNNVQNKFDKANSIKETRNENVDCLGGNEV